MKLHSPEEFGFSSKRLQRINTAMQRYVDEQKLGGTVAVVARRGKVVHFETTGRQDIAANQPLELDTIFRIYSMTKPIASTALMMLYEHGLFHLTDPVTNFIPAFRQTKVFINEGESVDQTRPITIQDLLRHTAGLGYGPEGDSPVDEMYRQADLFRPDRTLEKMIGRLAEIPLLYQPGQGWHYSFATDVVGRLVEIIAGMSLAEYLDQKIFQPLGMVDTAFWVPPDKRERFAQLYGFNEAGELAEADNVVGGEYSPGVVKLYAGGHGLVSTAADYLRFAQLIMNQGKFDGVRLLGRKTVELMTTNHLTANLMPLSYNGVVNKIVSGFGFGLGFRVMLDPGLTGVMGSPGCHGWGGAANTVFWLDPREALIGILMTQCATAGVHPVRNNFRTLVYQALVD